jgi:hypothetical protein
MSPFGFDPSAPAPKRIKDLPAPDGRPDDDEVTGGRGPAAPKVPDITKVPAPGGPVPIPYPNI